MADVKNIDWKKFFFSFEGRVNRKKYWLNFVLPYFILIMVSSQVSSNLSWVYFAVYSMLPMLLVWPFLAVSAKRLHDFNISGWYQAVIHLFTLVPLFYRAAVELDFKSSFLFFVTHISLKYAGYLTIAFVFFLLIKKGTDGPNRFGPDPLKDVPSINNNDDDGGKTINIEPVGAGE